MKRTARYVLSLDFDFHVVEEDIWDWQHAESPFYRDQLWGFRAAGLLSQGVDPEAATTPPGGRPDIVAALARARLSLSGARVVVSDSHLFALKTFRDEMTRPTEPVTILHFDAHHDLGYRDPLGTLHGATIECGDWLYWTLLSRRLWSAQVIYPEWKGSREWDLNVSRKPWVTPIRRRVRRSVFPDLGKLEPGSIGAVHIARSGSWVPPWFDREFIALVRQVEGATGTRAATPYRDDERCDPLVPRPWSWDGVRRDAETFRALRERARPVTPAGCTDASPCGLPALRWVHSGVCKRRSARR